MVVAGTDRVKTGVTMMRDQDNMRKMVLAAACCVVIAVAVGLGGCREQVDLSELEQFVQGTAGLPDAALVDTLRSFLPGGPPRSTYASFMLGNYYYDAAADTAAQMGWDALPVPALLDSAEIHFARAIAQDSTFVEAMVNLGSVWDDRSEQRGNRQQRDDRVAQAERFYQLALTVAPTDEKAHCNLGGLYLRQRRTQDALDQFTAVLDHDPDSALAHYNLAIMFAEQKIYREALREWELAAKCDPDGDIGERSRANVRIVKDLMNAPDPQAVGH